MSFKKLMMSGEVAALPPTPDPADVDYQSIAVSEIAAGTSIYDVKWCNVGSNTGVMGINTGTTHTIVYYWSLSSAWDLSTAGTRQYHQLAYFSNVRCMQWIENGYALLGKPYNNYYWRKYAASSPYDPSTLSSGYTTLTAAPSGFPYMVGNSQANYSGHWNFGDSRTKYYFGVSGGKVVQIDSTTADTPSSMRTNDTTFNSNFMTLRLGAYATYGGNGQPWDFHVLGITDNYTKAFMWGRYDYRASVFNLANAGHLAFATLNNTENSGNVSNVVSSANLGATLVNYGNNALMANNTSNRIDSCTLSTAYDLSTSSAISTGPTLTEGFPSKVFAQNSSYIQYCGSGTDKIYSHSTSSWNAANMSSSPTYQSNSLGSEIRSFAYANGGNKVYTVDNYTDEIKQWNVSNSYRPDTIASSPSYTLDLNNEGYGSNIILYDISFNSNGSKMFVMDSNQDQLWGFKLTSSGNINSAVPDNWLQTHNLGEVRGIWVKDATKFYVNEGGTLCEYSTSSWNVGNATNMFNPTTYSAGSNSYGIDFADNGKKLIYVEGTGSNAKIKKLDMSSYALSTAVLPIPSDALNTGYTIYKFCMSRNGHNIYIIDGSTSNRVIRRFYMNTAWDLANAYEVSNQVYTPPDPDIKDVQVAHDGSYIMFVYDYGGPTYSQNYRPHSVALSTAYDLSTAGTRYYPSGSGDNYNDSIAVVPDGSAIYSIGNYNDRFAKNTATTPYQWTGSTTITGPDITGDPGANAATCIRFNGSGSKMWVHGAIYDNLLAYPMTSYYDMSTADVNNYEYIQTDGTILEGMSAFDLKPDDTKFYFSQGTVIYQADIN